MKASEAFSRVSAALTAMDVRNRNGERVDGLCALSTCLRELPPHLVDHWESVERNLEFASTFHDLGLTEEAAAIYCREALGLIHYATMMRRKRQIDREISELSFCAREEA